MSDTLEYLKVNMQIWKSSLPELHYQLEFFLKKGGKRWIQSHFTKFFLLLAPTPNHTNPLLSFLQTFFLWSSPFEMYYYYLVSYLSFPTASFYQLFVRFIEEVVFVADLWVVFGFRDILLFFSLVIWEEGLKAW